MNDAQRVADLDAWLETMRGPDGYGGPVAHWWQNCLSYTGAGLDWRYEGLISGYLTLWARTGEPRWAARARRAGDDLRRGLLQLRQRLLMLFDHRLRELLHLRILGPLLRELGQRNLLLVAEDQTRGDLLI